jgi:hypothetical protein|tara:strand:+ start:2418 stop:2558 length:141 start_codon:yes stop_codon:yes gene_type:complete
MTYIHQTEASWMEEILDADALRESHEDAYDQVEAAREALEEVECDE